jgi:phospholipid/cholesterol/gamma-HCH transport system substrate-binding protein
MRFWIGLFVLAALVLLGTLIVLFGSLPTLFKRVDTYVVRFTDAPGITPGTPVRRSGVRIGEVTDIGLDDETGEVHVKIGVEKRFTIRHNEQPTLIVGLLGTDATLDFVPKPVQEGQPPPDRSPVPPGTELVGARVVSMNTLINRASEVVPTTQEALNDLRKSMKRFEELAKPLEDTMKDYRDLAQSMNKAVPEVMKTNTEILELTKSIRRAVPDVQDTVNDVGTAVRTYNKLGERLSVMLETNDKEIDRAIKKFSEVVQGLAALLNEENQRNIAVTIRNVREGSERLPSISRNTDELLKELQKTIRRLDETLKRADEAMNSVQQVTKPLSERGGSIVRNLDESLDKLNRTMTDVRQLMQAVGQSNGTLNRLINDPSLYNHLDEAICAISKTLPRVDRILKDLETFADKLARHPESIGVSGVIRPGSGLKDPPTASGSDYPPSTPPKSPPK